MQTLRNLGATDMMLTRVFLYEGRMISAIGAVVGILLGLLLCWLQQEFGLVAMGDSSGTFVVNAYPVSVHYSDVAIVFVTVLAIGWAAAWYPVRYMSRRLIGLLKLCIAADRRASLGAPTLSPRHPAPAHCGAAEYIGLMAKTRKQRF